MEAINPNDIAKLDTDNISCITLKNGKMVTVDKLAPEKYNNKEIKLKMDELNDKKFEKLLISKNMVFSLEKKENYSNLNLGKKNLRYNSIDNQNIIKNNFNLISNISKNINFFYKPSLNKNLSNTISNTFLNKEIKEEKMAMPINSKSRNNLGKKNSLLDEKKDPQKPNFIISLNIPADLGKHYNLTQKTFISMAKQLRQKRYKYSSNEKDRNIYQRYYELYKSKEDNIKLFKSLNIKKIQHYQKPEKEDKYKDILNKYKINRNSWVLNGFSNIFPIEMNDSNTYDRTTANSFYGNKSRLSSSESKIINFKSGNGRIGYSSTLICPSNIFKSQLG